MLRDLIVAAWVKSAEPVPDWHDHAETPTASVPDAAAADQVYRQPWPAGFKYATLRYAPAPVFPDKLRRKKVTGTVVVGLKVDKSGNPEDVHIIRGLGNDLDNEALKAVRQYKFSSAIYQGESVVSEIKVEVNFRIY